MTQFDPNEPIRPATAGPVVTETIETVVVRESNTGWWVAGILGGAVLLAVLWILFARGAEAPTTDQALLQAEAEAAVAQANADQARIDSQVTGAQASVAVARADAARAASDARAAEARAETPVVIQAPPPTPAAPPTVAPVAPVVSPTAPQN